MYLVVKISSNFGFFIFSSKIFQLLDIRRTVKDLLFYCTRVRSVAVLTLIVLFGMCVKTYS